MPLRQVFESPGLKTPASLSCLRGRYSNMALGTVKGSIVAKQMDCRVHVCTILGLTNLFCLLGLLRL